MTMTMTMTGEEEYPIDDTLSQQGVSGVLLHLFCPPGVPDFAGEDFTIMFNGRLRVERGGLDNEDDD